MTRVLSGAVLITLAVLIVWFAPPSVVFVVAELLLFMSTGPVNSAIANLVSPTARASAFALSMFMIHLLGDVPSPTLIATRYRNRFHAMFPDLRITRTDWFSFAVYPLSGGFKPWSLVSVPMARRMLGLERKLEAAFGRIAAFRMMLVIEKTGSRPGQ